MTWPIQDPFLKTYFDKPEERDWVPEGLRAWSSGLGEPRNTHHLSLLHEGAGGWPSVRQWGVGVKIFRNDIKTKTSLLLRQWLTLGINIMWGDIYLPLKEVPFTRLQPPHSPLLHLSNEAPLGVKKNAVTFNQRGKECGLGSSEATWGARYRESEFVAKFEKDNQEDHVSGPTVRKSWLL